MCCHKLIFKADDQNRTVKSRDNCFCHQSGSKHAIQNYSCVNKLKINDSHTVFLSLASLEGQMTL